jgi:hypothetical protein
MNDEHAKSFGWTFWINLVALCALAFAATLWFQRHFRPFFTEIVLVGGTFTLWAALRLVWGWIEKATRLDIEDTSRRLLSQQSTTRFVLLGAIVFGVLWWSTGSLYFELAGAPAGAKEVRIEVRRLDGSPYQGEVTLTADAPLVGRPLFWLPAEIKLTCHIVEPFGYEPYDCPIGRRRAPRIETPRQFDKIEMHLLRFVPRPKLYAPLPEPDDAAAVVRYELIMRAGDRVFVWPSLRQGTLYSGRASSAEIGRLAETEDAERRERELTTEFLPLFGAEEAAKMAAQISMPGHAFRWGTLDVKAGTELVIEVDLVPPDGGERRTVFGPERVVVSAKGVQTIWLGAES